MLKASPLMHEVGKEISSAIDAPARAAAKDLGVVATCWTGAADCTMAEADGVESDTHGQRHVYVINDPWQFTRTILILIHACFNLCNARRH